MAVPVLAAEKLGSMPACTSVVVGLMPVMVSWVHVLATRVTVGPLALST